MSVAVAAAELKDADEALGAAQAIRRDAFEALIVAVADAGWRPIFRDGDRVVVEHFGGRSAELKDLVAALLREGAAA